MKKLRRLRTRLKFSRETTLIFAQLKKHDKAEDAMDLHEWKIAFQTLLATILVQSAIIILYWILNK